MNVFQISPAPGCVALSIEKNESCRLVIVVVIVIAIEILIESRDDRSR